MCASSSPDDQGFLQSRGADPSIRTEDYDPYLNPGHHLPIDIASEDAAVRAKLLALDEKYAATPKVRSRNQDLLSPVKAGTANGWPP